LQRRQDRTRQVNRDHDRLVQALLDGAPARTVMERMAQLEARGRCSKRGSPRARTSKGLSTRAWPTITARGANLREALAREGCQAEAAEIMRTLIDKIVLAPVCRDGKETLSITLHGDIAGILGLAAKAKKAARSERPFGGVHKSAAGAPAGSSFRHRLRFRKPPCHTGATPERHCSRRKYTSSAMIRSAGSVIALIRAAMSPMPMRGVQDRSKQKRATTSLALTIETIGGRTRTRT
jgi:hypothetical protein